MKKIFEIIYEIFIIRCSLKIKVLNKYKGEKNSIL